MTGSSADAVVTYSTNTEREQHIRRNRQEDSTCTFPMFFDLKDSCLSCLPFALVLQASIDESRTD